MIRLLVVDDYAPTRQEIVQALSVGGLIKVVGEAETSNEAAKAAEKLLPDIVLLDLHLPGFLNSVDLIKRLVALRNCKVVMFASAGKASEVQDLLDAGAAAYILKDDPPALIRMAILMVQKGAHGVISPSLPRHLTRLSTHERHVLRAITMRGTLKKAAERLSVSQSELDDVVGHLCEKLELASPDHLVRWAKKHGF